MTPSTEPHLGLSVPATLHASLMARLDRLGPAAKDVAQIGAAIGREFGAAGCWRLFAICKNHNFTTHSIG